MLSLQVHAGLALLSSSVERLGEVTPLASPQLMYLSRIDLTPILILTREPLP